jgi:hypothetical protein
LTALGVVFLWKQMGLLQEQGKLLTEQLRLLKDQQELLTRQVIADHDRSRRENAINYLFEWSRGLLRANSLARKLVEGLSEKQTVDLVDEKPLRLSIEHEELVLGVLSQIPEKGLKKEGQDILLSKREVSDIRWQVVRYLNTLESIFAAARYKVADRDILIDQFGFLVSPEKGYHLLRKVREALGGAKAYPGLHELEEELEQRRKPKDAPARPDHFIQPH